MAIFTVALTLRRRAHPGLPGRGGRVRLPRAPQRLRVRRRRAQEGGLRQRRRGRQARRRGGEDIRALPPLRGSLRARPRLHQPLPGQREGQRREQGRLPQEEPVRPRPVVPRRPRVQPVFRQALLSQKITGRFTRHH